LGFVGWAVGGSAAVIDSVIPVNFRLHNTLWVPAHFHTYLLLGVIFWVLAFVAHLLESAAGRAAGRFATVAGPATMVLGGYGLVGAWYVSGAIGVPRRYAEHFGDTTGYSVIGGLFTIVFALGLLIVLVEFARLGLAARAHRRPAQTASAPQGSIPAVGSGPFLTTPLQLTIVVAASVIAAAALLPPIVDASEVSTRFHHLAHSVYFFFGALFAVALAATPPLSRRVRDWSYGAALAIVIVAPTLMLLAMIPSFYESMESRDGLHALYHAGMITLGIATGMAAVRLGRTVGRIVFVLSIGMAVMYAAGVTGG
jgi:hypothetical protein